MITGELKNKVDSIWDTIWTGGITSPITVLEQITYLMFMKLLDDNQLKAEANANVLGVPLKNKVFQEGVCIISENPHTETDYRNLRWNVFHNFEPGEMLANIQAYVFPFIKTIGEGKDTAFSRYMKDTVFLIPTNFVAIVGRTNRQKLAIQQSLDMLEVLKNSLMQQYFG